MKASVEKYILSGYAVWLLVVWVCTVGGVQGQSKAYEINGIVRDKSTQQPLISATITAYKLGKDTLLTAYSFSDVKGKYRLSFKKEGTIYRISAKAFGYEEQVVEWRVSDSIASKRYDFELIPMPVQLKEVVVKAQIPIRSSGDTTIYNAKAFSNGSERSVEDLLKKLPGVQVKEDGKIMFNGKLIQKVLLEGEDFFGKKYELITRNMGADLIDKIEAIDNYSENSLLSDIRKSGEVALNLTIHPDRKLKVFGNVAVGLGLHERFETNGALFSLVGRLKAGVIGNANNIGYDPISTTQSDLEYDESDFKGASGTDTDTRPFIQTQLSSGSNLSARRSRFNRVGLGGANANYKVNDRLKIRMFGYYSGDRQNLISINELTFLTEQSAINVRDSSVRFRLPKLYTGQIRIDYQPNTKTNFQVISNLKHINTRFSSQVSSTNVILSENITSNGSENSHQSSHQLKVVRRLEGKNAFLYEVSYSGNNLPQQNTIVSGRYATFFKVANDYNKLLQQIDLTDYEIKSTAGVKGTSTFGSYTLGVSYFQKNEYLRTETGLQTSDFKSILLDSSFINNTQYTKRIGSLEGQYSIRKKKWQLSAGGVLQVAGAAFEAENNVQNFDKHRIFFNPNINFGKGFGNKRVSLQYSRSQALPSLNDLIGNYIMKDYRNFQRGTPLFNLTYTERFALTFLQSNYSKLYSYWLSVFYNKIKGSYINQVYFSDILNFQTFQPINTPIRQYSIMGQLDKLIFPISTKIRWEGMVSQFDQINVVQGEGLRKNRIQTIDNQLFFISAFDGNFNFEASSQLNLFRIAGLAQFNPTLWRPKLVVFIKPLNSLHLNLTAEYYSWRGTNQNTSTFFNDLRVGFYPKDSKWTFNFDGTNLFNDRFLLFNQISNVLISTQRHYLQPRILIIRIERKF